MAAPKDRLRNAHTIGAVALVMAVVGIGAIVLHSCLPLSGTCSKNVHIAGSLAIDRPAWVPTGHPLREPCLPGRPAGRHYDPRLPFPPAVMMNTVVLAGRGDRP